VPLCRFGQQCQVATAAGQPGRAEIDEFFCAVFLLPVVVGYGDGRSTDADRFFNSHKYSKISLFIKIIQIIDIG